MIYNLKITFLIGLHFISCIKLQKQNEKHHAQTRLLLRYFNFIFNRFNSLVMYMNTVSLKELSNKMYRVYSYYDFDMEGFSVMFNYLMSEHNFRYMSESDLSAELLCELGNDSVEDLFLDKINRMDINEKIFYDIAFEFIEPMKVYSHLLIPQN